MKPTANVEQLVLSSEDHEKAILASMIQSEEATHIGLEQLTSESFYYRQNQHLFQAISDCHLNNTPIEILTLSEALKKQGVFEEAGGMVYIAELSTLVATGANIRHYIESIKDYHKKRQLRLLAQSIETQLDSMQASPSELAGHIQETILDLQEGSHQAFSSMSTILDATLEEIERNANTEGLTGVPTGFGELDQLTAGWQSSDMIILGARPSCGKTGAALKMIYQALKEGKKVAFFSLEMSQTQIMQRLLSIATGIELYQIRTGRLSDAQWVKITQTTQQLSSMPLFIDETAGLLINDCRIKAQRLHRQEKIDLWVLDYLQLMRSSKGKSLYEEVSDISKGIKQIAKETNTPFLALSQLSRGVESRPDRRPQLSDLRESGCLSGDTLISMADTGEYKTIKSLLGKKEHWVWSLNTDTYKIEKSKTSNVFSSGIQPVFNLTTQLGRSIKATADHKFYTIEGWKALNQLTPHDHIATPRMIPPHLEAQSDIYWDKVKCIEESGEEEVFDLTVPGNHNFIANDIIPKNSLEQDADAVILIYRPGMYNLRDADGQQIPEDQAQFILAKQRNGPVGNVNVLWTPHLATYQDIDDEYTQPFVSNPTTGEGDDVF